MQETVGILHTGVPSTAANSDTVLRSRSVAAAVGVIVLVATMTFFLDVRPFTDVGERFIGHSDQADVALVARNIVEGRGANVDAVWLLHGGGPAGPEIRHPEGYWSVYVASVIALWFGLLGANLQSLMVSASVVKTLLCVLGFVGSLYLLRRPGIAMLCGLMFFFDRRLVNGVNGLSDIYLALSVVAATVAMVWAVSHKSKIAWLLCGGLTGIAIGMKPSGLILIGLLPVLVIVSGQFRSVARSIWPYAIGLSLCIAPLAVHNLRAGGTVFWPDMPILRSASLQVDAARPFGPFRRDDETRHLWRSVAYDPESEVGRVFQFSPSWWRTHVNNLAGFAFAFLEGSLVPLWSLPLVLLGVFRLANTRLRQLIPWNTPYELLVAATVILTIGACCLGAAVHCESRYYMFLVPLYLVISCVEATALTPKLVGVQCLLVVALGLPIYFLDNTALATRKVAEYQELDQWLPTNARVMTQHPLEFAFHTRRQSVVLPYNSDPKVLKEVASRFNLSHLVVLRGDVTHPELENLNRGEFPPFVEKMHHSENLIIGRFVCGDRTQSDGE